MTLKSADGPYIEPEPLDLTHSRRPPYEHQVVGVEWLVDLVRPEERRTWPGCLLLADEMGAGKTKQVIDAAQVLYESGEVSTVIVVAPAPVRSVWFDDETGELKKHLWQGLDAEVTEYHGRRRSWAQTNGSRSRLHWIITNYEYVRHGLKRVKGGFTGPNLEPLLQVCGPKTLLVLDESSAVKSWRADQTRACKALRRRCGRVWLLNGTPISQSPCDVYSQADIMDARILACGSFWQFRSRYALMGGWMQKQIIGWFHAYEPGPTSDRCIRCGSPPTASDHAWDGLGDLRARLAPYTLRRLKVDCLDLPPKLDPVTLEVTLTNETWRHYKELRDELVTWLGANTQATAAQAGTRVMRLAQLTAGFLGGLKDVRMCTTCEGGGVAPGLGVDITDLEPCPTCDGMGSIESDVPPREVGREKLDLVVSWICERLLADPQLKLVVWCRFRAEVERLVRELRAELPVTGNLRVAELWGGQRRDERRAALHLLHPDTAPDGVAIVVGTLGTGSVGLNLAAAHEVVYLSNGNSLFHRLQSMDRVHRPGQRYPVSYLDIVAVGPKGQKTIDHTIVKALREREELASWTCAAWVAALKKEEG